MAAELDPPATIAQRHAYVRAAIIVAASLVVAWVVLRLVGAISWSAIGDALRHLSWWHVPVLVGLLCVRQIFNAFSISRFVPGMSWPRAIQNDLGANLVATVAPPPADIGVRVAMFRSWGINPVDGMTGVTLNMVVFYGVRFLAPVLGLFLLAFQGIERGDAILGTASAGIAVLIIAGLLLFLRSDAWAARLGRTAARIVGRMRASVDAAVWSDAVVDYRAKISSVLRENLVVTMAAMLTAVVVDSLILLSALRFVGVGSDAVSGIDIVSGFLLLYPLTILPLFGLGVMDAILVANWTYIAGDYAVPMLVAGLIVWRTVTIGGTLLLGVVSTWRWRRETKLPALQPPSV